VCPEVRSCVENYYSYPVQTVQSEVIHFLFICLFLFLHASLQPKTRVWYYITCKRSQTKAIRGRTLRSMHIPLPENQIDNLGILIPVSIPASQSENFESSINDTNGTFLANMSIASLSDDYTDKATIASSSEIQCKSAVSRAHSQFPILVNTKAQEVYKPIEVDLQTDNTRRKRAMPIPSFLKSQGGSKVKKSLSNLSISPRDSSVSAESSKTIFFNRQSPYVIQMYLTNDDPTKSIHPLLITRVFSQIAYVDIKEIKKIGRGKVLAEMSTAKAANNLTCNSRLEKEGLKAFISIFRTIRSGIIKDISQHFNEVGLLEFFDAPYKVTKIGQLNRRIRIDGKTKYIPSYTVCLKFAGQILSKYVFFCRTRHEVYHFVPKAQICFSCYKIGHINKTCKDKPRCIFCGGDAHESGVTCSSKSNAS